MVDRQLVPPDLESSYVTMKCMLLADEFYEAIESSPGGDGTAGKSLVQDADATANNASDTAPDVSNDADKSSVPSESVTADSDGLSQLRESAAGDAHIVDDGVNTAADVGEQSGVHDDDESVRAECVTVLEPENGEDISSDIPANRMQGMMKDDMSGDPSQLSETPQSQRLDTDVPADNHNTQSESQQATDDELTRQSDAQLADHQQQLDITDEPSTADSNDDTAEFVEASTSLNPDCTGDTLADTELVTDVETQQSEAATNVEQEPLERCLNVALQSDNSDDISNDHHDHSSDLAADSTQGMMKDDVCGDLSQLTDVLSPNDIPQSQQLDTDLPVDNHDTQSGSQETIDNDASRQSDSHLADDDNHRRQLNEAVSDNSRESSCILEPLQITEEPSTTDSNDDAAEFVEASTSLIPDCTGEPCADVEPPTDAETQQSETASNQQQQQLEDGDADNKDSDQFVDSSSDMSPPQPAEGNVDTYTLSQKKFLPLNSLSLCRILTDFQNFCTTGKLMKFATTPMRHYPPHLRYVATLPWKIKNSNFIRFPALQNF